tara:strand:+ start:5534 stop:5842 length:309 start_codon:yes stop_codon:yes gene_type:complete
MSNDNFKNENEIIAKFMRGKPSPPNWTWDYHETWDSLIPVIEKIIHEEKGMFYLSAPNFVPGNEDSTFSLLTCADNNIRKKGDDFFKMAYESVIEYLKNRQV